MLSELNIITIFPELIDEWKKYGIVNQGIKKELITINTFGLRNWGLLQRKKTSAYLFLSVSVCLKNIPERWNTGVR